MAFGADRVKAGNLVLRSALRRATKRSLFCLPLAVTAVRFAEAGLHRILSWEFVLVAVAAGSVAEVCAGPRDHPACAVPAATLAEDSAALDSLSADSAPNSSRSR